MFESINCEVRTEVPNRGPVKRDNKGRFVRGAPRPRQERRDEHTSGEDVQGEVSFTEKKPNGNCVSGALFDISESAASNFIRKVIELRPSVITIQGVPYYSYRSMRKLHKVAEKSKKSEAESNECLADLFCDYNRLQAQKKRQDAEISALKNERLWLRWALLGTILISAVFAVL